MSSSGEEFTVELPVKAGPHTLVYEVCLGEEVYHIFTILPQPCAESTMLMDDGWGAVKDAPLWPGRF